MGEEHFLGELTNDPIPITLPEKHKVSTYNNLSSKYINQNVDFKKQYCKIYTVRLERMFELLEDRILKKWGKYLS